MSKSTPSTPSTPSTLPAPAPTMASGPEPLVRRRGAQRCIYFPDDSIPAHLLEMLKPYPRASLSNIVAQLLTQVTNALTEAPEKTRSVTFDAQIWL